MSDKQTAPWIKKLAEAIQRKYRPFSGGTEQLIEIISETFAVECRAPAPQLQECIVCRDLLLWEDGRYVHRNRFANHTPRWIEAATPQVTPEKCPMCKSMTRDIRNRLYYPTEVSMCFDSWHNEGTSEQASPDIHTVKVDWDVLSDLYSASFNPLPQGEGVGCDFCGAEADRPSRVQHGLCGNDPCPAQVTRSLLWPTSEQALPTPEPGTITREWIEARRKEQSDPNFARKQLLAEWPAGTPKGTK